MELRIYSPELNLIGIIENQTSLIWTRKYFEPGEFELHAPITPDNLALLQKGNIVWKRGDPEAAIIEDIMLDEGVFKTEAIIKGRFMSAYMDYRLIKQTVNINDTAENAMRQLLAGVAPIPLLELGVAHGFGQRVSFQATYKNLMTYETKLAKAAGLGYRFRPDFTKKKIFFEVYAGNDHSSAQGVISRVIFSESYNNLNHAIYRFNDQRYKNVAYVGGEGDGSARVVVKVGNATGLALRELFVDAKDIRKEDGMSDAAYRQLLIERGFEKLSELPISESFECDTGADINFKYGIDYDLGDIITVKKIGWGITQNFRISEIREIYEYGGVTIEPTFGDPLPEKIDWRDE